ncbi:MAG: AsnC family transcriptional regulator [Nitrosarchaeum sp.]|nr:AsnC family transcriptional regulator [Nitrosarchaeum sp.]
MSFPLDETDIAILETLIKDGRKSFRQIAKEIKVSTPTVKIRYERLFSMGIIKSISPILDMKKLGAKMDLSKSSIKSPRKTIKKIDSNLHVKIKCDYCDRKISEKPSILKVGDIQRFFCCPSCRVLFQDKYQRRIKALMNSQK